MKLEKLLREGSEKLGIKLDEIQISKFFLFLDLMVEWNRKLNLTAITDKQEIVIKHFIDSLTVSEMLNDGCSVLDIGSGGGFPGIPLAVCCPGVSFTLLDAVEKKIFFINESIRKLELTNVTAVKGRADSEANGIERKSFDFVVTRAVGHVGEVLDYSIPYINSTGKIVLMRGKSGEEEWKTFAKSADKSFISEFNVEIKKFKLPLSNIERTILSLKRI